MLISYRRRRENLVHRLTEAELPTRYGRAGSSATASRTSPGNEPIAIVMGDLGSSPAPLVQMHSSCFTGDLLASLRCDCGDQLHLALNGSAWKGSVPSSTCPRRGAGSDLSRN